MYLVMLIVPFSFFSLLFVYSEEITAAICLPLIMPSKSVRVAHTSEQTDWTCIVLGFNSGYVRFYDEVTDFVR